MFVIYCRLFTQPIKPSVLPSPTLLPTSFFASSLMLPLALLISVLALGASVSVSAASSSSGKSSISATPTSASPSSSNSIGTPSNSAALPSLSGVSSCVSNCLAVAASADGCVSLAAVDCFCPNPKNYTTAFLGCLNACPSEVASAEALVEQFCAAASKSTSLSFASFTPSSSASVSGSSVSGSSNSASASATAPPTSSGSSSASTTPNAAARGQTALPLLQLGVSAAGVLLAGIVAATVAVLPISIRIFAPLCPRAWPLSVCLDSLTASPTQRSYPHARTDLSYVLPAIPTHAVFIMIIDISAHTLACFTLSRT
ncbi:CFEM domain-containing protein [Mycena venus]|uniref:CFEM domain-containing protein n=1 Tax=Mycena venus TaxID=2733690 RepID=A0A8H6YKK1_9AGAR|nr:CFEM domain-containing protein [Mycena venus]